MRHRNVRDSTGGNANINERAPMRSEISNLGFEVPVITSPGSDIYIPKFPAHSITVISFLNPLGVIFSRQNANQITYIQAY